MRSYKEGGIIQRVTNKQLLEHPEQTLWPFSFAIKWTFVLASIIVGEGGDCCTCLIDFF